MELSPIDGYPDFTADGWNMIEINTKFVALTGVFADIDYEEEIKDSSDARLTSLQEMCVNKIVTHAAPFIAADVAIAPGLQNTLTNKAIWGCNQLFIRFLLKQWRTERLHVDLRDVYRTWKIFTLFEYSDLAQMSSNTSLILFHFIQTLTSLKTLDLSAFPISDSQIEIICSAVRSDDGQRPSVDIYLSCAFMELETLKAFCCALQKQTSIKIIVKSLYVDVMPCPDKQLLNVLKLIDPHELEKFGCRYVMCTPLAYEILDLLKDCHFLKAMRLKYRGNLNSLKLLLDNLVNLERLDLRDSNLRDNLEFLIGEMYQKCFPSPNRGLKYLNLTMTTYALSSVNFEYLANSPYTKTLLNLDLSFNTFGIESLSLLIRACKNLRVLNLRGCRFIDSNFNPLFEAFTWLSKLVFLNIQFSLPLDYMLFVAPLLGSLPSLLHLRVESPFFHTVQAHYADFKRFKEEFLRLIQESANSRRLHVDVEP